MPWLVEGFAEAGKAPGRLLINSQIQAFVTTTEVRRGSDLLTTH